MNAYANQAILEDIREELERIRRSRMIIARGEEVKELLDPTSYEGIDDRLTVKYGEDKAAFIWEVEICYFEAKEKGDFSIIIDGFTDIDEWGDEYTVRGLKHEIRNKSHYYAKVKYKGYGFTPKDFEQEFILEVFRLMDVQQTDGKEMFTFYERVMNAFPRRALDLVREVTGGDKEKPRNKQLSREYHAQPIHAINETEVTEGTELTPYRSSEVELVEAKILVEDILSSGKLTQDELKLLEALKDEPEATNNKLAKRLGFSNHKVKRLRNKLADKLQEFNPYL